MIKAGVKIVIFSKKNIALSEISLMLLSVFAVAVMMGNLGIVRADPQKIDAGLAYDPQYGDFYEIVNIPSIGESYRMITDQSKVQDYLTRYSSKIDAFSVNEIKSPPAAAQVPTGAYAYEIPSNVVSGFVTFTDQNTLSIPPGTYQISGSSLVASGGETYEISDPNYLKSISAAGNDKIKLAALGAAPTTTTEIPNDFVAKYYSKLNLAEINNLDGLSKERLASIDPDLFATENVKDVKNGVVTFNNGDTYNLMKNSKISADKPFVGTLGQGFAVSHLLDGFVWALGATAAIQTLGSVFGVDKDNLNTINKAVVGGIFAGQISYALLGEKVAGTTGQGFLTDTKLGSVFGETPGITSTTAVGIGLAVAAAIFVLTYEKQSEKREVINFQCLPFEPQLGGAKCEECNADPFRTCSQYRCKSLGQACELLNEGTGKELCAWIGRNDVNSPVIKPWEDALRPDDLKYTNDNTRPPSRGVKITTSGGGCLKAFTQLEFGITTDEPSQCKIDYEHTNKFDEMRFYVGGSNYYAYNHSDKFNLPSVQTIVTTGNEWNETNAGGSGTGNTSIKFAASGNANELGSLTFPYDGEYSYYIRCRDGNGNENVDEYAVSFCVDQSPDTTPPIIDSTSIKSGGFVRYNVDNVSVDVYTNEAAECKWSRTSKNYDDMENKLNCAGTYQVNAEQLYTCNAKLTGIKNNEDNKFYFRCKDNPGSPEGERNVMTQSYELILKGTEPLQIVDVSPNGTITSSTSTSTIDLGVETANGAEEGKSLCYFSTSNDNSSYVAFFESNNYIHKQSLDLTSGSYTYYLRCIDAGGNSVDNRTSFTVFVDKFAPKITRVYKEEALKIVTDEEAVCAYSLNSCNFNVKDGVQMIYSNINEQKNHYTEWEASKTYYIRCADKYGNEPDPNKCSLIVNAVQFTNSEEE